MARQLDQILVVDVESTCWEGAPPDGQVSEIIEIGLCTVDVATLSRGERKAIFVRPTRSEVSDFCTQLTGITTVMLEPGVSLEEACASLQRDFRSKERLWASWGDYDRRQFERVCELHGVETPFGPSHLNVKTLFAATLALKRELGVAEAARRIGSSFEGRQHRGEDDAWNIAAVLCWLLARGRQ